MHFFPFPSRMGASGQNIYPCPRRHVQWQLGTLIVWYGARKIFLRVFCFENGEEHSYQEVYQVYLSVVRKEGKGKRLLNFVEGKGKFLIFSVSLSCNRKTIYLYQSLFMRAFYAKKEWRARARRKDTSTQVIQAKRKVRHLFLRMWCYLF